MIPEIGSFLLDFAISTLSSEQGYHEVAQSILPQLAVSQQALLEIEDLHATADEFEALAAQAPRQRIGAPMVGAASRPGQRAAAENLSKALTKFYKSTEAKTASRKLLAAKLLVKNKNLISAIKTWITGFSNADDWLDRQLPLLLTNLSAFTRDWIKHKGNFSAYTSIRPLRTQVQSIIEYTEKTYKVRS